MKMIRLKNNEKNKKMIFSKALSLQLWLLAAVTVLGLVLGCRLMLYYNDKTKTKLQDEVGRYLELNDNQFRQLNQELLFKVANDSNIKGIAGMSTSSASDYKAMLNYTTNVLAVQTRLSNLAAVYGNHYYFWIYEAKSDTYVDYGDLEYTVKAEFRERFAEKFDNDDIQISQQGKWYIEDGYLWSVQKIEMKEAVELDEAAKLLNRLMDEVQLLEIEKYEQKLKYQKTELEFAQQQHKATFSD